MKRRDWSEALRQVAKDIEMSAMLIMVNKQKQTEQNVPTELTRHIQALQKIQRSINASKLKQ